MNPSNGQLDYQTIALVALGAVMSLLSFFGINLWNDVRMIKEKWITREEFKEALDTSSAASAKERDSKHLENTGNFRRLEERIAHSDERHFESAVAIEKRLGEMVATVAQLRPPQRQDGPERRRS